MVHPGIAVRFAEHDRDIIALLQGFGTLIEEGATTNHRLFASYRVCDNESESRSGRIQMNS
jgi:hypothetical protein